MVRTFTTIPLHVTVDWTSDHVLAVAFGTVVDAKLCGSTKGSTVQASVAADGNVQLGSAAGSPSAMAQKVTGYPVSGWQFWHLADDDHPTLKTLQAELEGA